jgi:hypothetical protein
MKHIAAICKNARGGMMTKYISVDDLRAATTKRNEIWNTITDASGRGLDEIIDSLPSADVQPVRHGRWYIQRFGDDARCSECGMSFKDVYDIEDYDRYCRHCGARMLGVAIKKWE